MNLIQKGAERLIEIKSLFLSETGVEISDEYALKLMALLDEKEIISNTDFCRFVTFAAHHFILHNDVTLDKERGIDKDKLLDLLDDLPEREEDGDKGKMNEFKYSLKKYFNLNSDQDISELFSFGRGAVNKQFNRTFMAHLVKEKYRAMLMDL